MIVRRRLAQKMAFILEDTAHASEPTDEEARRIHEGSPERFLAPARVWFTQVFFSRDRAGGEAAGAAAEALHVLASTGAPGDAAEI